MASPSLPKYSWREYSPDARLTYCTTVSEAEDAVKGIKARVVGFDMEWKPSKKLSRIGLSNYVALIQIATDHEIILIQLSNMYARCRHKRTEKRWCGRHECQRFPPQLKRLLEDPGIIKAGAGISGDAKKLYNDWRVQMCGCVDLSLLTRTMDNLNWGGSYTTQIGLAELVACYAGRELQKGLVRLSNWEAKPLSFEQQEYAANDAHAGLFLFYYHVPSLLSPWLARPWNGCFMFDAIGGELYHPGTRTPWVPLNPFYDPRPPTSEAGSYSWSELSPNAQIRYCWTAEEANRCISFITSGAVGFDFVIHQLPGHPLPRIPLVLLANGEWIVIIQMNNLRETFPTELRRLLQSDDIIKAGSVGASIHKFCEGCLLSVSNIIDLSLMARCVDGARWASGGPDGLPALVAAYDDRLYTDESSALAGMTWADVNWEAALTEDLMSYAANAAHSRWHLYTKLAGLRSARNRPPKPARYTYDATAEGLCAVGTNTRLNLRTGEASDHEDRSPVVLRATQNDVEDEASVRGPPPMPAVKPARTGSEPSRAAFFETSAQERRSVEAPSINSDVLRALREKAVTQEGRVPKPQASATVDIPTKKRSRKNKVTQQERLGPSFTYQPPNEETAPSRRKARKAFYSSRATSISNLASLPVIEFVKETGSPSVSYH